MTEEKDMTTIDMMVAIMEGIEEFARWLFNEELKKEQPMDQQERDMAATHMAFINASSEYKAELLNLQVRALKIRETEIT